MDGRPNDDAVSVYQPTIPEEIPPEHRHGYLMAQLIDPSRPLVVGPNMYSKIRAYLEWEEERKALRWHMNQLKARGR